MLGFIKRYLKTRSMLPLEVAVLQQNFKWTPAYCQQLIKYAEHKKSKPDRVHVKSFIAGVHLDKQLWTAVDQWWKAQPASFAAFFQEAKKAKLKTWGIPALQVVNRHASSAMKHELYALAAMSLGGQQWLLSHGQGCKYLGQLDTQELASFCVNTINSMQNIDKAFLFLKQLTVEANVKVGVLSECLKELWMKQHQYNTPMTNAQKAWGLSTDALNQWMDTAVELPWWFDPVNSETWVKHLTTWCLDMKLNPQDILVNI